mmetsp:Transcript_46291/g.112177  ORF Transcript_46291/g.112177 Transcript_46291/m.112177 type:complete len:740 (-) Transcript_46291:397-2616(-)|eukprot:CAMPEP_0113616404 /NCGR_PEP_ID=MMETSP0017_2-20120614/8222_1 /TAXON_ID=2856 /ORGANISM="Cylindrotheca closterium" /LENGTH=739 /DNA_ID=CAMNT_0000525717 /DNA_START=126 /DNA_END=2345 /DNA_ORIENTATION=+ /assembly_acc=CAM_ASM_000147
MVKPSVQSKSNHRYSKLRAPVFLCILALFIFGDYNLSSVSQFQLMYDEDNDTAEMKTDGRKDNAVLEQERQTHEIANRIESESEDKMDVHQEKADTGEETIPPTPAPAASNANDIESVTETAAPSAKESSNQRPLAKSSVSGYLMYVLTLQGVEGADDSNAKRYDNFKRHWSIVCNNTQQAIENHQQYVPEEIHFHKCPGYLNPKGSLFGYGLSMAYKECFEWALEHHDKWHADHNTVVDSDKNQDIPYIFLEDDARLYNSNFCHSEYRNRLWNAAPSDTTVLMLGGHNLFLQDKPGGEVERTDGVGQTGNKDIIPTFRRPNQSAGSYGFVVPKTERVAYLRRKIIKMLNRTFTPEGMLGFMGIDKQFYLYPMLKVYITQPWLVYHEGGLYSNNKDRVRGEYGQGSGQYRWVPGLTGSFRNCSAEGNEAKLSTGSVESSNKIRIAFPASEMGNWYTEEAIIVSCQPFTLRIPQSLIMLQNSTTSDRIIAGVVSDSNRTSWRSAIRSTWGKPDGFVANEDKKGATSNHTEVNVFFLVTGSWEEIASEFREHDDLVWIEQEEGAVPATTESSSKALQTAFQVASFIKLVDDYASCLYSYLLRVPDDAYANLPGIQSQLLEHNKREQVGVWGTNCRTGLRPFHIGIPETQYSDYFFPEYCKGKAYALSQPFVRCAAAHIAETRIVSLDDTYIGLLGERCGLEASQFLSSSSRVKGDERLLKLNFTQEDAIRRRHAQQQMFWS